MSAIPASLDLISEKGYSREELCVSTGDLLVQPHPAEKAKGPAVLWHVRKGRAKLYAKTPISVTIRSEGEYVFAENDTLRVFGHGPDLDSAIRDFHSHVIYLYEYYSGLEEDQVMGEGLRLKKLFNDLFRPAA